MRKFTEQYVSKIAIAVVIGGVSLACSAYAADTSTDTTQEQSGASMTKQEDGMKRIDERIKELHDAISVTAAQQPQWDRVTKVMRQNEASIHKLVEDRNKNENANAVDDLRSYEKITYAHDQGLRRLIPVFEKFYDSLTTKQKTSTDNMFGRYEGRMGDKDNQSNAADDKRNAAAANDRAPDPADPDESK